jgi:preprotein translocase subunit SecA
MNDQRKVIYDQRKDIMSAPDVAATIADMRAETIAAAIAMAIPEKALAEQWNTQALHSECHRLLALDLPIEDWAKEEGVDSEEIEERVLAASDRKMAEKVANYGAEQWRMAEKGILLQILDQTWKDHLLSLDHLRQAIGLRAYAQRDPLNEYKREAFELFEGMLVQMRDQVTSILSHIELRFDIAPPPPPPPPQMVEHREPEPAMADAGYSFFSPPPTPAAMPRGGNGAGAQQARASGQPAGPRAPFAGTGRNSPCPCGSGKKFKHCHGRI